MTRYSILILLFVIISCKNTSKEDVEIINSKNKVAQLFDNVAAKMIDDSLINSTSIGIYHNEKEYISHYGELEKGKGNTPNNKTIYEIGSLSKVITGTVLANAVLENKITLEDDVNLHLDKKYNNLSYSNQPIKIKHLITHTSGLPNMLPLELNPILADFLNYETPTKINEVLSDYDKTDFLIDIHTIKIDTIPGFKPSYSSAGTELTAYILEKVYKTDYEDLLINFLSEKIGMRDTKITLDQEEMKNLAVGYHTDNSKITLPMAKLPWGASGGIKSTTPDMVKFIKYQLENNEIVQESHRPIYRDSDDFGLGYFWEIDYSDKESGIRYLHHGGVPRSQCYVFIIPKYNFGAFIITNQSGQFTARKMNKAVKEIFDSLKNPE